MPEADSTRKRIRLLGVRCAALQTDLLPDLPPTTETGQLSLLGGA